MSCTYFLSVSNNSNTTLSRVFLGALGSVVESEFLLEDRTVMIPRFSKSCNNLFMVFTTLKDEMIG